MTSLQLISRLVNCFSIEKCVSCAIYPSEFAFRDVGVHRKSRFVARSKKAAVRRRLSVISQQGGLSEFEWVVAFDGLFQFIDRRPVPR
jgi:hypothetical protein